MFWFHCGRCGALFQSQAGDIENRLCAKCGFDPHPGHVAPPAEPAPPAAEAATPAEELMADHSHHHGKRNIKKRKSRHLMVKLIGGWLLLLAIIILGAKSLWRDENTENQRSTEAIKAEPKISEADAALLAEGNQKINKTFSAFLATSSAEERNQFVLSQVTTASRMARFQSMNSLAKLDPATLSLKHQSILRLPGKRAIECQWASKDGRMFDTVFREENGEWRLDWEHFARYGDYPWSLFLAGTGEPEGEFRLLARERTVAERKDKDTTISLILYAPRFGQPGATGFQSPEFIVPRDSRDGKLLEAAFAMAKSGKQPFGLTLPNLNPDGMIRVNVRVRRTDTETGRKFEITGIKACHWYSDENPGVEPAAAAVDQPAKQ